MTSCITPTSANTPLQNNHFAHDPGELNVERPHVCFRVVWRRASRSLCRGHRVQRRQIFDESLVGSLQKRPLKRNGTRQDHMQDAQYMYV